MRRENLGCVAALLPFVLAGCGNSQDGSGSSAVTTSTGGSTIVGSGTGGYNFAGSGVSLSGAPGVGGILTGAGGIIPGQGAGGVIDPGAGGADPGAGGTGLPPETGGAGSVNPPPGVSTATITLAPFTIDPGAEVFMCQNFDNPFGGVDAAIQRTESNMTKGSHHLHLFYGASDASRNLAPCSGLEFHPLIHGSQEPHAISQYPAGMATKLQGGMAVRFQVHYLNTTTAPLPVQAAVSLTTVDPTTVDKWVAQLYMNRIGLSVPPGNNQTVTTTCTIPTSFGPIGLIGGVSHMHKWATHFVANTSTGVKLYDTTQWDEPVATPYDPPVLLNPGDKITWTCTYNNDSGRTLTFGESAAVNEMCIFTGRFYSSPTGQDLECMAYGANN
jgi:hypothetical protein